MMLIRIYWYMQGLAISSRLNWAILTLNLSKQSGSSYTLCQKTTRNGNLRALHTIKKTCELVDSKNYGIYPLNYRPNFKFTSINLYWWDHNVSRLRYVSHLAVGLCSWLAVVLLRASHSSRRANCRRDTRASSTGVPMYSSRSSSAANLTPHTWPGLQPGSSSMWTGENKLHF